jgi:hypothetical protein
MRQLLMGAVLLGAALMVTFAAASLLQGWALANRSAAEPFVVEKITPDTTTAKRAARNEPGHSVVLVSHHIEM